MKLVYMGTPEFAVASLEALINQKHEIAAVVSQPDKQAGRGNKVVFSAVKEYALRHNITVLQPQRIKDAQAIETIRALQPQMIVVAAYGQILPKELLVLPPYGCINVHGSLLPKYRGAAPIQWALINGETLTGVTIMHMSEKMDAGDMVLKKQMVIETDDNYKTLHDKMAVLGAQALIEALELIETHKDVIIMQNDAEVTYAPMITNETGNLNWNKEPRQIVNLIRGLNPAPGAYTFLDGKKLKIWKAEVLTDMALKELALADTISDEKADFGTITAVSKNKGIIVKVNGGQIIITQIQAPNAKRMDCADFLRGREVKIGAIFTNK